MGFEKEVMTATATAESADAYLPYHCIELFLFQIGPFVLGPLVDKEPSGNFYVYYIEY